MKIDDFPLTMRGYAIGEMVSLVDVGYVYVGCVYMGDGLAYHYRHPRNENRAAVTITHSSVTLAINGVIKQTYE